MLIYDLIDVKLIFQNYLNIITQSPSCTKLETRIFSWHGFTDFSPDHSNFNCTMYKWHKMASSSALPVIPFHEQSQRTWHILLFESIALHCISTDSRPPDSWQYLCHPNTCQGHCMQHNSFRYRLSYLCFNRVALARQAHTLTASKQVSCPIPTSNEPVSRGGHKVWWIWGCPEAVPCFEKRSQPPDDILLRWELDWKDLHTAGGEELIQHLPWKPTAHLFRVKGVTFNDHTMIQLDTLPSAVRMIIIYRNLVLRTCCC